MNSIILRQAATILSPILLLFSVTLLLGGHDRPGGGFIGGLVASSAFVLHATAFGTAVARRRLRVEPHFLMGAGLALAISAGLVPLLRRRAFLTGSWIELSAFGSAVKTGTPVLFDLGVYLVVLGTTLMVFFHLRD